MAGITPDEIDALSDEMQSLLGTESRKGVASHTTDGQSVQRRSLREITGAISDLQKIKLEQQRQACPGMVSLRTRRPLRRRS